MATTQQVNRFGPRSERGVTQAAIGATFAVLLAMGAAIAVAGLPSTRGPGAAADRAANDGFYQFLRDEHANTYPPSVEDIRRSLIRFRASERASEARP